MIRDYLPSPTYAPYLVAPFFTIPFYDDSACNVIGSIEYFSSYSSSDPSSGPYPDVSMIVYNVEAKPIGTVDTMTFSLDFANLYTSSGIPQVERFVNFVDGH